MPAPDSLAELFLAAEPARACHLRLARAPRRRMRPHLLTGLALAVGVAGWGSVALRAPAAAATPDRAPARLPMRFKAPGESFPGLAADDGVADPPPAMPGAGDAAPARFAGASPLDRGRALTCLTTAIYYEAATEPDDGQQAVAQVVLNRLAHPAFPKTVCGVVYQGSERPDGCQFTFACDGSLTRAPAPFFWRRAEAVARSALAGAVFAPIGLATHYHAFTVHPAWADALAFVGQIGAHRFYRMEGAAGAAGAFRFAYAGGEPLPLPHLRAAAALAPAPDPLTIERAPAYPARGGDAALRMAEPAAGDIRPEYRASGSWIAQPM